MIAGIVAAAHLGFHAEDFPEFSRPLQFQRLQNRRVVAEHVTERKNQIFFRGEAAHPAEFLLVFTAGFIHIGVEPRLQRPDRVGDQPMLVGFDNKRVGATAEHLLPAQKRQPGEGAVTGGASKEFRILLTDAFELEGFWESAQRRSRVCRVNHGGGADLNDAKGGHIFSPGRL